MKITIDTEGDFTIIMVQVQAVLEASALTSKQLAKALGVGHGWIRSGRGQEYPSAIVGKVRYYSRKAVEGNRNG